MPLPRILIFGSSFLVLSLLPVGTVAVRKSNEIFLKVFGGC